MIFTVLIAGTPVKVILDDDVEMYQCGDGRYAEGTYQIKCQEIRVAAKGKTEAELKPIILHEIIHAIFGISGLWQGLEDLEELICANLESFLTPLIEFKSKSFVRDRKKSAKKKKKSTKEAV